MTVVGIVCAALLAVSGALCLIRVVRGPSMLDRTVATDVFVAAIVGAVSRADVARQLQSLGVDPEDVKTRVAAMTDSEARTLAGQIASAPAGADVSGWVVALVLVVVLWALYAYR